MLSRPNLKTIKVISFRRAPASPKSPPNHSKLTKAKKPVLQPDKRFRALIEKATDVIVLLSPRGKILYTSPAMEHILGYTPEEFTGVNGFTFVHPRDLHLVLGAIAKIALKPGSSATVEVRARHKNGHWIWVESIGTNLLSDPDIHAIVANIRDITERKILQQKIAANEQQLQAIIDGSTAVIYLKDLDGKYLTINRQFATLFHTAKDTVKGQTDFDLFVDDTARAFRHNDLKVIHARRSIEVEEIVPHPDGPHTYISMKFPLYNERHQPYAICGISTDITERKRLEERKDDFINMASHELKTPVTSLRAYVQILQKTAHRRHDDALLGHLDKMDRQITKLTTLINDLLSLSRIQAGKLEYRHENFSLSALVHDTVETLQGTTTHRLVVQSDTDVTIQADKDRLGQVLINLIANAIKYSPPDQPIIVRLRPEPDKVVVAVQDFGLGIDPKHHPHVFERFYQATDRQDNTFPGLGIGLYICAEIIRHHHGRIWFDSTKNQGSTFYFSLPTIKR